MQLSYRQLETILAAYLRVHPDRMSTFRSRLKQLQRLEFPPGVNIGRGVRMAYSATHLLQLAVAFELVGLGLPAKSATDAVIEHWPKFEAAFGRTYNRQWVDWTPGHDPAFVCIPAKPPTDPAKGFSSDVTVEDRETLFNGTWNQFRHGTAGYIVIEASELFGRLNKLAQDVGQEHYAFMAPEYKEWGKRRKESQEFFDNADGGPQIPF